MRAIKALLVPLCLSAGGLCLFLACIITLGMDENLFTVTIILSCGSVIVAVLFLVQAWLNRGNEGDTEACWQLAKRELTYPSFKPPPHVRVFYQLQQDKLENLPAPNAKDYQRLAAFYGWASLDYGRFLAATEKYYRRPIKTVLDLACGTGLLTRQFTAHAELVVGLDVSEEMLQQARSRTTTSNVRYVHHDFRNFSLEDTFDAAVCGGDSLNYVETPEELSDVFGCVYRHLRPGGFFVFDVLDEAAFLALGHVATVTNVGSEWFEIRHYYDPKSRVSENRTLIKGWGEQETGNKVSWRFVERHRRIPIEVSDVRQAALQVGLNLLEHFHADTWSSLLYVRQFYLLQRPV